MKNKKGSVELISIIIIVIVASGIALIVAGNNKKQTENLNNVTQSKLTQITL